MRVKITKHQAGLINRRHTAFITANSAAESAKKIAELEMRALSDCIGAVAADNGIESDLDIEQFTVESKGDDHALVLVEKPKQSTDTPLPSFPPTGNATAG